MFCLPLVPARWAGRAAVARPARGGPRPALDGSGGPRPFSLAPLPLVAPRRGGRGYGRVVSAFGGLFCRLTRGRASTGARGLHRRPLAFAFRARAPLPFGRVAPPFPLVRATAVFAISQRGSPKLMGASVRLPSRYHNNLGTLHTLGNRENGVPIWLKTLNKVNAHSVRQRLRSLYSIGAKRQ